MRNLTAFKHILYGIFLVMVNFVAVLSPMIFTVGVIACFDRCGARNRLVQGLDQYGKAAQAVISYRDDERGTAGVHYFNSQGKEGFGVLTLSDYPAEVSTRLQPGAAVQIVYIDALVSGNEKVVIAEYEQVVRQAWCITPDLIGTLVFFWLVVMFKPQAVFVGFIKGDTLMEDAGGNPFKRVAR